VSSKTCLRRGHPGRSPRTRRTRLTSAPDSSQRPGSSTNRGRPRTSGTRGARTCRRGSTAACTRPGGRQERHVEPLERTRRAVVCRPDFPGDGALRAQIDLESRIRRQSELVPVVSRRHDSGSPSGPGPRAEIQACSGPKLSGKRGPGGSAAIAPAVVQIGVARPEGFLCLIIAMRLSLPACRAAGSVLKGDLIAIPGLALARVPVEEEAFIVLGA